MNAFLKTAYRVGSVATPCFIY